MTLYRYSAIDAKGRTVTGELEAASPQAVADQLNGAGYLPIEAVPQSGTRGAAGRIPTTSGRSGPRIPAGDLALLTRKLATILQAGLDLERGLQMAGAAARAQPLRRMVEALLADIRGGKALSEALTVHRASLPRYYVPMVQAGEAGGTLPLTIERIGLLMEQSEKLRRSIVSALIYPAILVVTALGSIVLLMTVVIPRFEPLFRDAGKDLPFLTNVFMMASDWLIAYGPLISLGFLLLVVLFRRKRRDPEFRLRTDRMILRIPLLGEAIVRMEVALLARTLGILRQNRVSLTAALSIVESSLGNAALAAELRAAQQAVKDGSQLAPALARGGLFPDLALQFIAVGESTGRLAEMLIEAGTIYEEEVQTTIQRMLGLLTPIVTLGLSLVIAAIIGSVLVAVLSVNDLVL